MSLGRSCCFFGASSPGTVRSLRSLQQRTCHDANAASSVGQGLGWPSGRRGGTRNHVSTVSSPRASSKALFGEERPSATAGLEVSSEFASLAKCTLDLLQSTLSVLGGGCAEADNFDIRAAVYIRTPQSLVANRLEFQMVCANAAAGPFATSDGPHARHFQLLGNQSDFSDVEVVCATCRQCLMNLLV